MQSLPAYREGKCTSSRIASRDECPLTDRNFFFSWYRHVDRTWGAPRLDDALNVWTGEQTKHSKCRDLLGGFWDGGWSAGKVRMRGTSCRPTSNNILLLRSMYIQHRVLGKLGLGCPGAQGRRLKIKHGIITHSSISQKLQGAPHQRYFLQMPARAGTPRQDSCDPPDLLPSRNIYLCLWEVGHQPSIRERFFKRPGYMHVTMCSVQ